MKTEFATEEEVLEVVLKACKANKTALIPITADCPQEVKDR